VAGSLGFTASQELLPAVGQEMSGAQIAAAEEMARALRTKLPPQH